MKIKKCIKCNKFVLKDSNFCITCGSELRTINKNEIRQALAIGAIVAIAGCVFSIFLVEQKRINDTHNSIEQYQYEKIKADYESTPTISDLKINPGWTNRKDGNYVYISGSVTNTSDTKTISYFEVEAKFINSNGDVIDSDWTNDSKDLEPGETRQFEIMHRYNSNSSKIRLLVKEVK